MVIAVVCAMLGATLNKRAKVADRNETRHKGIDASKKAVLFRLRIIDQMIHRTSGFSALFYRRD
jgi:hypothetical protein